MELIIKSILTFFATFHFETGTAYTFSAQNDPWNPIAYLALQSYGNEDEDLYYMPEGDEKGGYREPRMGKEAILQSNMSWIRAQVSVKSVSFLSQRNMDDGGPDLLFAYMQDKREEEERKDLLSTVRDLGGKDSVRDRERSPILFQKMQSRFSSFDQIRNTGIRSFNQNGAEFHPSIQSKQQVRSRCLGGEKSYSSIRRRLLARKSGKIQGVQCDSEEGETLREGIVWICDKMRAKDTSSLGVGFLLQARGICLSASRSTFGVATTFFSRNDPWNPNPLLYCTNKPLKDEKWVAAHPSLPCGSKVMVIAPRTGRRVVVTVLDRGPRKALIDLSEGASRQLRSNGMEHVIVIPLYADPTVAPE